MVWEGTVCESLDVMIIAKKNIKNISWLPNIKPHLPSTHSKEGSPFGCWIIDLAVISIHNLRKDTKWAVDISAHTFPGSSHHDELMKCKIFEETWKLSWWRFHNRQYISMNVLLFCKTFTSVKVPFPLGSTNMGFTVSMRSACPLA